jgi:hypothetical protein
MKTDKALDRFFLILTVSAEIFSFAKTSISAGSLSLWTGHNVVLEQ